MYKPRNKRRRMRRKRTASLQTSIALLLFGLLLLIAYSQFTTDDDNDSQLQLKQPYSHWRTVLKEQKTDFPDDPFTDKGKKSGAILCHILFMIYMFVGLAKVRTVQYVVECTFVCIIYTFVCIFLCVCT